MKLNRSLAISSKIQDIKTGNIISLLEKEFPSAVRNSLEEAETGRNRIFTFTNTLLAMVLTATQQDKSLKNSVDLYYVLHQRHKREVLEGLNREVEKQKEQQGRQTIKKAGRP